VESSSKTKAPKATTYYHYSFFMVHFLSFCSAMCPFSLSAIKFNDVQGKQVGFVDHQ
jgi:hypothetical protein